MRFAGDLFRAFRPGGDAFRRTEKNIMGADREARHFLKKHPWTLGGVGYGLSATGALDQPFGLAGSFGDQSESKSPFPIGGFVGRGLFG